MVDGSIDGMEEIPNLILKRWHCVSLHAHEHCLELRSEARHKCCALRPILLGLGVRAVLLRVHAWGSDCGAYLDLPADWAVRRYKRG